MNDAGDRSTFRTKTGWGQSGKLFTGDKTRRVTMQADFNKGVGAFDFTAQFNITPPAGGAIVNAEALVHWRVEGQEVTRRITLGAGTTLTGVGQAVRIEMFDATPPQFTGLQPLLGLTATLVPGSPDVALSLPLAAGVIFPNTLIIFSTQPHKQYTVETVDPSGGALTISPPYSGPATSSATMTTIFESTTSYDVSVQVSAGVRGSSGQPPLLQPFDGPPYTKFGPGSATPGGPTANPSPGTGFLFAVDALQSLEVTIPQDAGATQVFITVTSQFVLALAPGDTAVEISNKLAPQRLWDPLVNTEWVPIPPGAESLLLTFRNGAPNTHCIFSVTFGIDG